VAYLLFFQTFLYNFVTILNPNLTNGDYFYAINNVFVKTPLLILNILLILLSIYSIYYGKYEIEYTLLSLSTLNGYYYDIGHHYWLGDREESDAIK